MYHSNTQLQDKRVRNTIIDCIDCAETADKQFYMFPLIKKFDFCKEYIAGAAL